MNYKLALPKTICIHPVFHVSLLEKASNGAPSAPIIEAEPDKPAREYKVEKILSYKFINYQAKYLIK